MNSYYIDLGPFHRRSGYAHRYVHTTPTSVYPITLWTESESVMAVIDGKPRWERHKYLAISEPIDPVDASIIMLRSVRI